MVLRLPLQYFKAQLYIGLTIFFLSACGAQEQSSEETTVEDKGTTFSEAQTTGRAELNILYVPAPGFAYYDQNQELTGVTIEIMRDFKAWFERYHGIAVQLNFVAEQDWSDMYQRVSDAQGGVFGLGNVTMTDDRRSEVQFSPAYLHNVAVLITPDSMSVMETAEDFARHTMSLDPLAFAGTLHEVRVRALRDKHQPDRSIARVTSNQAVIDGVVNDHYSYVDAYNYHRAVEQGVAITSHPAFNLEGEQFGIIMPHSNDWNTLLTAFFAAEGGYLGTPRYAELLESHLGTSVAQILLDGIE